MKPLNANCGLPFVVRSPNLDLKVSSVFTFLRHSVEEALMRMRFKRHFSQKETNPRSQGPFSSSRERSLLKRLRMALVKWNEVRWVSNRDRGGRFREEKCDHQQKKFILKRIMQWNLTSAALDHVGKLNYWSSPVLMMSRPTSNPLSITSLCI